MNKLILTGCACATMLLPAVGLAHGGNYRGPGDVVPPRTGNPGGPSTGAPGAPGPTTPGAPAPGAPRPGGPTTPGPSAPGGPSSGGPGAPGPGGGPITGGRGRRIGTDLGKWQFWWEFNKDPFINLRDAIHARGITTGSEIFFMGPSRRVDSEDTAKPSTAEIQNNVLPALKRALDITNNRDITSSCMIALAKIGRDHKKFEILPIFRQNLSRHDQEIRETAALAMGISAMPEAVVDLVALARDESAGRKLCGDRQVDARTRSFSCYALGLVAYSNSDIDLKRQAFEALESIIADEAIRNRNIKVAAINSVGLLNLKSPNANDKAEKLLTDALACLDTYFDRKAGRGTDLIKSHVPPAIAKLIGRGTGTLHVKYKAMFNNVLSQRGKKYGINVYRAVALALGQLAKPGEICKDDAKYSKSLLKYFQVGKDAQARYFSLLALGQIGGDVNREKLLHVLRKGKKALERPWAAVALGVLEFRRLEDDPNATVDPLVGDRITRQLTEVKNPDSRGAFAVALGLCRCTTAASELMDLLKKHKSQNELAGYLCIGLALMNHAGAKTDIHTLVKKSVRRPELLQQAAVALGKLGDKTVTSTLIGMLNDKNPNLAKLSAVASALGFIGDRRTIAPLREMLFNEDLTPLSRAFAAVALGGVAAREKLPWNSKIARNMNYRGSVETLTTLSGTGVLDIL